jgi:hypothetical protein
MQLQNLCVNSALCLLLLLLLARYYGQSKPWGADVRKHMAYLTAEQALAGLKPSCFWFEWYCLSKIGVVFF